MKRKKVTDPGKGFDAPLVDDLEYYYKKVSYDEVFRKVRNDIDNNFYTWTYSTDYLKDPLPSDVDLSRLLRSLLPICPDLFESDSPSAKKLRVHFAKLLRDCRYARTPQEREKARGAIDDIMESKTPDTKWKKIPIPPLLSLNDMYEYLHRITKFLKQQYTKKYGRDPLPEDILADETELKKLRKTDPRLVEIEKKGLTLMLIHKPGELTKKLMADCLGLTTGTLRQYLKKHPGSYTPPKG